MSENGCNLGNLFFEKSSFSPSEIGKLINNFWMLFMKRQVFGAEVRCTVFIWLIFEDLYKKIAKNQGILVSTKSKCKQT